MTTASPSPQPDGRAVRASIIIPTLGNPLLHQCLDSLRRNVGPGVTYEVVIVANGAAADFVAEIDRVSWASVRLINLPVNLGFGGACNRGAAETAGEFLVFLNDDTEVLPGWLEALVSTADDHPTAGAVGSLMLFPDGSIQEAGSIVWQDGSTRGVSRGVPVDENRYDYLRAVDYCSACSLLVRRALFVTLRGFDDGYFPAYYEDVDFCFALARAGFEVLLQPRSRLVHHESASSSSPRKRYLALRHRELFRRRWAEALEAREPARPDDRAAVARAVELARGDGHLLIVDDRPPQRGCGSGFSVLLDAIEAIADTRQAVSLATSDRLDGDLQRLADLGVHVMREAPEVVLDACPDRFDRVLIARPHNFVRYAALVRRHQPRASILYLAEALFYRRMQRHLELVTDADERSRLTAEMLQSRELERAIPLRADQIVCVSDEEAAILSTVERHCPVQVIRPVEPGVTPTNRSFDDRGGLLFTPGWLAGDASPNVDALQWFVAEVLPRVIASRPDVRLRVTGANPPAAVTALAGPSVELLGFVPDLRGLYDAARVVVVPMRVGSGVKVKCLEALQHGVPVVSTSVGAEGLSLNDPRALVVTDDPDRFAAAVLDLYDSREAWERQRVHVLREATRWRLPERTWRDLLASPGGDPRHEPEYSRA